MRHAKTMFLNVKKCEEPICSDLASDCGVFKARGGSTGFPMLTKIEKNFFIKIVLQICTFWVDEMKIAKNGIFALKPVPKHDYV